MWGYGGMEVWEWEALGEEVVFQSAAPEKSVCFLTGPHPTPPRAQGRRAREGVRDW